MYNIFKKAGFATCLFLLIHTSLIAQKSVDSSAWQLDQQLLSAYNLSLALKLKDSRELLNNYQGSSLYGKLYLQHFNDALEVFITEDPSKLEDFEDATDDRIDQLKDAPESPYKKHYLSEIKLHNTFIQLKFGQELTAAWNFRQAYNWCQKNLKNYPDFDLPKKNIGLMHIVIGSAPEKYRWLLNILGFKGTLVQGLDELQTFSSTHPNFAFESDIIFAFIQSYLLQNYKEGLQVLDRYEAQIQSNILLTYAKVSILIKASQSEKALFVLEDFLPPIDGNSPLAFPFIEYQKGNILLQRGDYKSAVAVFTEFLETYSGVNYVKDSYFKIGLSHWLENDEQLANTYFDRAQESGHNLTEADKNASNILSGKMPDKNLLKIRLATDGGYYEAAGELIDSIDNYSFANKKDSTEYIYRKARFFHKSGQIDESISYYSGTIELSGKSRWYFAPNSCLQLGYIYQEKSDKEKARKYFEKAMTYKNHPYKNSIDNKAQAALSKME